MSAFDISTYWCGQLGIIFLFLFDSGLIVSFLFVQLIYLAIVGGTYFLVANSSFGYIPGYYIGEIHRYVSRILFS